MSLSRKIGGRPLLMAGFGSLLLLMVMAGGYALETLEQVRRSDLGFGAKSGAARYTRAILTGLGR